MKKIIISFLLILTSCYDGPITPSTHIILTRTSWRVESFIDSNINRTYLFSGQRFYFYNNNTVTINFQQGNWFLRYNGFREEILLLFTMYPQNLLSNDWEIVHKSTDRIELINRNTYPYDYLTLVRF